ncbi:DUF6266 family protein [Algoriphagus hitonicola]|uniref:DUF6266 family protein n=1 Tax=Algoriphagus hitonicola TaxID=435880 RepID=UPI0011607927|nr:hypothetical protein [Algoriphagus hitonicola]
MGNLPPKNLFFPQGKIGNLVFYSMNGKTVVRTRPSGTHRNKTHPSPLQLLQREKLKTINRFLKPLKRVLDFGYQEYLTQRKKESIWPMPNLIIRAIIPSGNPKSTRPS